MQQSQDGKHGNQEVELRPGQDPEHVKDTRDAPCCKEDMSPKKSFLASGQQRESVAIGETPSPTLSVISISSDTDAEEDTGQRCSHST